MTNFKNLQNRQFGRAIVRPSWQLIGKTPCGAFVSVCAALFAFHIGHVVCLSANEQMGGIDAGRIVAAMANQNAWSQRFVRQFPNDAVSVSQDGFSVLGNTEFAVAATRSSRRPNPATIAFLDFGPKAQLQSLSLGESQVGQNPTSSLSARNLLHDSSRRRHGFDGQMFPSFARHNSMDLSGRHSELTPQLAAGNASLRIANANDPNFFVVQLRAMMSHSLHQFRPLAPCRVFSFDASAFGNHIRHVFFLRRGKQMSGTNATPIVAAMANAQTIGHLSKLQNVSHAMRKKSLFNSVLRSPDLAIPRRMTRTLPLPTSLAFGHLTPEASLKRFCRSSPRQLRTLFAAKVFAASPNPFDASAEGDAAVSTLRFDERAPPLFLNHCHRVKYDPSVLLHARVKAMKPYTRTSAQ